MDMDPRTVAECKRLYRKLVKTVGMDAEERRLLRRALGLAAKRPERPDTRFRLQGRPFRFVPQRHTPLKA